jgi:hypothetical protein
MAMNDSYLFDAGWLFLAAWSVIVAIVSVTAFRGDMFPSRTQIEVAQPDQSPKPTRSAENHFT